MAVKKYDLSFHFKVWKVVWRKWIRQRLMYPPVVKRMGNGSLLVLPFREYMFPEYIVPGCRPYETKGRKKV